LVSTRASQIPAPQGHRDFSNEIIAVGVAVSVEWQYLDAIEVAIETAAPLPEDVVPALLLLSRRNRALKERDASTEQAP
jgi:hypothetical protein